MKFYAVNLKPFSNGTTRWLVYELVQKWIKSPSGNPNVSVMDWELKKLWPKECHNHKLAKQNGFTYTTNRRWPAYHIYLNEIGTSHEYLLKEQVCYILKKERGMNIDPNKLDLEVLG